LGSAIGAHPRLRRYDSETMSVVDTGRPAPYRNTALLGVAIGLIGLTGAALAGALSRREHARVNPTVLGGQLAPEPAAILVRQGSDQAAQLLTGLFKLAGQRVTLNYEIELVPAQSDAGRSVQIWFTCKDKVSESTCEHGAIAFAPSDPPPTLTQGRVSVVGDYDVAVLPGQPAGTGVVLTKASP
jgi:hypothetical protein